ncbi:hypothetical protein AVEN_38059-1 [Araneus ventricosus]|uniref:Uncharacterized protein n=1 Tax=Araneus ventricosus TaxID=182803 RepID=A0A4Y2J0I2_ARAVE|nr:hypothetical protein AVEN_38059-1 [Araneus ventricosus]
MRLTQFREHLRPLQNIAEIAQETMLRALFSNFWRSLASKGLKSPGRFHGPKARNFLSSCRVWYIGLEIAFSSFMYIFCSEQWNCVISIIEGTCQMGVLLHAKFNGYDVPGPFLVWCRLRHQTVAQNYEVSFKITLLLLRNGT